MTERARWIRLGLCGTPDLTAACEGLAAAQRCDAAPILLWAQARSWLGAGLVRAEERQCVYVLIAPRRLAPGRVGRWPAWALAPAVATYRDLGLPAYLQESEIWLHGCRIAGSGTAAIGGCVLVASNFLFRFPSERFAGLLESAFRARLESQYGWQFDTGWPTRVEHEAIKGARAGQKVTA